MTCNCSEFNNKKCECGWVYKEREVITKKCKNKGGYSCDVCDYCGPEKCPKCGGHLHCGGCV